MLSGDEGLIVINWGSSAFRAELLDASGAQADAVRSDDGVLKLDRSGIERVYADLRRRWPSAPRAIAAGMIGSNVGWATADYASCPAGPDDVAMAMLRVQIADHELEIVPGLACEGPHGAPDVMRGEEVELFGLAATWRDRRGPLLVALPGTHTKWARMDGGVVTNFVTTMNGEIFDRLSERGVLASVTAGDGEDGDAFRSGVARGWSSPLSLGTDLFGARASAIRRGVGARDTASYLRGLLIGAELADAARLYPDLVGKVIPLVGNVALCALYVVAMDRVGMRARVMDAAETGRAGFLVIARGDGYAASTVGREQPVLVQP